MSRPGGLLAALESVAEEIHGSWDWDQRPGKLCAALKGDPMHSDPRVTRVRSALANLDQRAALPVDSPARRAALQDLGGEHG